MILRYTENMFHENHMATIGVDFKVKFIDVKDKENKNQCIKLQIWDTAYQERFHIIIVNGYFQKADGIFVVFNLSKRDSFNKQIVDLNDIKYFETSAKENTNIDEAFNYLAQKAFLQ